MQRERVDQALRRQAEGVRAMTGRWLRLAIPSVLAEGESFALRLSVVDSDALPCPGFPHTLHFENNQGIEGLPKTFAFEAGQYAATLDGLRARGPDVALVRARVDGTAHDDGDPVVRSNPGWIETDPTERLYWGDLHVHTKYSNCHGWRCLDPEWCYRYARDVSFLDFAAAADHLRGIASDPQRWPALQEKVRAFTDPERFVAFLAYESSHAQGYGGDNNVYFRDDDAPYFWLDREDMKGAAPAVDLTELWAQMDATGKEYFTVPHHTGRKNKYRDWTEPRHDPSREPLFEIYSSWGSSETRWNRYPMSGGNNDAPAYFDNALRAGARFGVIAASDDHATLPGGVHHFRRDPFRPVSMNGFAHKGLAGVWAGALDRNALYDALTQRRTFATTHARSLLRVRLGDIAAGQAAIADAVLKARREIRVECTLQEATQARVVLLRNGEPLAEESRRGESVRSERNEVVFTDEEPAETAAIRGARYHPEPFVVYAVRVEDNQGQCQWSSPIWLDLPNS